MSAAAVLFADFDPTPFSATVFPAAAYIRGGDGFRSTPPFAATASGVGPFTYAWGATDIATPGTPSSATTTYLVDASDVYEEFEISLSCVVTDTSSGAVFSAPFTIFLVPLRGRYDVNEN